jgi:hypothetical protein
MVRASAKTFLENEPPENLSVRNDQMGSEEAPPIVWAVRVPGQTPRFPLPHCLHYSAVVVKTCSSAIEV